MSDKVPYVPEAVIEAVDNTGKSFKNELKRSLKETVSQIFGMSSSESKKQQEQSKKLTEKAEKSGRSIEEQAKIESLRKQLHAQVTAPRPTATEQPKTEQEDQVGTNEQMQSLGDSPTQDPNALPPLAQPSMRQGERLKIRE